MSETDWKAVLLAYMRHVYDADHVIADPEYGICVPHWSNDLKSAVPHKAFDWLRNRYLEMLEADGMK
jgi:hypothetical protein